MDIRKKKNIISFFAVILSALIMAFATKNLVRPAGTLSGGFMGVAIMADMIAELLGGSLPTSIGLLCLNVPVALFCAKKISKRFVFFSLLQVILTSLFLPLIPTYPLFDDTVLNVIFGGFLFGISITVALKGNASTAGTDFIALYVSNKSGRSIWGYVFVFNTCILCIFGYMFGWIYAGYSIVFQFISTRTISSFYQRYKRVTLQITTKHPEQVVDLYIKNYRHGISVMNGYGGYSKAPMSLLHTVVSAYEVQDIVQLLHEGDDKAIINVIPTENFIGGFYQAPID